MSSTVERAKPGGVVQGPGCWVRVTVDDINRLGFRFSGFGFTLSQLGQARRGSWYEVGVTQERQPTDRLQAQSQI